MKKIIISMSILTAWATWLPAQITREKADEIVLDYLKNEGIRIELYVNDNAPSKEGFTVTTSNEEIIKAKYACWVYCGNRIFFSPCNDPDCPQPAPPHPSMIGYRYIFVKEDNGSLLEVITSYDTNQDLSLWTKVNAPSGFVAPKENNKLLYPNPVGDLLTLPCDGKPARVEIYDLKGTRLFSGLLSGEDACQLNVSFLSTGIYMISVSGEMYKIIKN